MRKVSVRVYRCRNIEIQAPAELSVNDVKIARVERIPELKNTYAIAEKDGSVRFIDAVLDDPKRTVE